MRIIPKFCKLLILPVHIVMQIQDTKILITRSSLIGPFQLLLEYVRLEVVYFKTVLYSSKNLSLYMPKAGPDVKVAILNAYEPCM